jgi:hypothetical protein
MIVDLALSFTGSQLIAFVLPTVRLISLDLHNLILRFLRECVVTLRGCKTGSKVIWLLYVHPIQFLLYPLSCVLFYSNRIRAYYVFSTYNGSIRFACMAG